MSDQIAYVGDTSGDEFLDVTFYAKIIDSVEVDFVNIKVPGDKTLEIDETVTEMHKRRFARKFSAYKQLQEIDGTPIADWSDVPEGLRRELNYQGFRFIEQVAGAPDSAFARIMGGIQWRVKAQSFLNKDSVVTSDVIKSQQAIIDDLQRKVAMLLDEKPKRGRPAREVAEA
jgi:hypothetical protein